MLTTELDINRVKEFAAGYFHADVEVQRTESGVSTYVYRIRNGEHTYYLRAFPEDASFAIEAKVHEILLEQGVLVPAPLYYEHKNALIGKSVMLTSEIAGCSIDNSGDGAAGVLYEAGKQLAVINSISVDGFSWIDRKIYDTLTGEKHTFGEYYYEKLYSDIDLLRQHGFNTEILKDALDCAYELLHTDDAFLAHGDFDDSHIYHEHGRYTGIIDFGEIRGSHYLYDLGHYKLHDEHNGFVHLVKGYDEIHKLTSEDYLKIDLLALFVAISRSKYEHYRRLLRRQLDAMNIR